MYIADLHIHSRYSRATSGDCTPEYLELWARRKGIDILGTGDFTHPAWREELKEKLVPAEEGFYTLKEEFRVRDEVTDDGKKPRFVVSGEISCIYKKDGKVRKVHSLLLLPDLSFAELLAKKLETIGNIHSDGRPILGLDCHDLLEIMLEICPNAIYIPAHIWTPHFSLFGAFSGFDSVEECFGDLTPYIRAMETGLSSDPPMNWRLSFLDSYQLISNSDAHSPSKLGREANLVQIPFSYSGLSSAILDGNGLLGTIEFFPEEGKYHYDGHRKCNLCLSPTEAEKYGGKCPVCGRKLTIGVSHRVEQLADRKEGFVRKEAKPFESLVPLLEVIAASTGHSATSSKAQLRYGEMLRKLGAEFSILRELPITEIERVSGYQTAEGIRRLRLGQVKRKPGYDGEYGQIELFQPYELDEMNGQMSLFSGMDFEKWAEQTAISEEEKKKESWKAKKELEKGEYIAILPEEERELFNPEQYNAIATKGRAIAVIAGPGSGKTKTLISRIGYLLNERTIDPSEITAVTFTNKAAEEMRERLQTEGKEKKKVSQIKIGTFHAICLELLQNQGLYFFLADETQTIELIKDTIKKFDLHITPKELLRQISLQKLKISKQVPEEVLTFYQEKLQQIGAIDFDDLLLETLKLLEEEKNENILKRFSFLLVDEFQDISQIEYRLIKAWNQNGAELFVIGDPDQSIYGFRGSDANCFEHLKTDYPDLQIIRLVKNYRSTPQILKGATAVISKNKGNERSLQPCREDGTKIRLITAKSEMSEAIFVAKEVNRLIGGIDMLDAQGQEEKGEKKAKGFSDIAVLYRTHRQADLLEKCLKKEGIPYIVVGRDDFLLDPIVRGCICFFKYLVNTDDRLSEKLCRRLLWEESQGICPPQSFESVVEKFQPLMTKGKCDKLFERWSKEMGIQENENLEKLISTARFHKTLTEFLWSLSIGSESDLRRCGGKAYTLDAVRLMTLHGSKGLEFPVVMIYGVRSRLIPLEHAKREMDLEEERRLFYVGMTRAKEELILITSDPSVFLEEIPKEVLNKEDVNRKKKIVEMEQMSLFDFLSEM